MLVLVTVVVDVKKLVNGAEVVIVVGIIVRVDEIIKVIVDVIPRSNVDVTVRVEMIITDVEVVVMTFPPVITVLVIGKVRVITVVTDMKVV